jgi:23S rRNA (adenine2030-N6)-methyltransferase
MQDDYPALTEALRDALKRFPRGIYITWYPLLDRKEALPLPGVLWDLYGGNRCGVEIRRDRSRGLYGSGLVIYNPPWPLREILRETLPRLSSILGYSWNIRVGGEG